MKLAPLRVNRLLWLTEICKGKRVLNLGCADTTRVEDLAESEHVHIRLASVASSLVGIDLNAEGLRNLASRLPGEYLVHDVERLDDLDLEPFDVVVAGELIEHVNNPGLMLAGIHNLLKSDGALAITTPNAFALKFFLHSSVRRRDISSDFHSVMFSPKTLRTLLSRHGFVAEQWAVATWHHGTRRSQLARPLLEALTRFFPQIADTLICLARRAPS